MKRTGPKTETCGIPQVRSEGVDFVPFTVTTCVITEEGQGKVTNTKSAYEASQKNAMVDCVEGSA